MTRQAQLDIFPIALLWCLFSSTSLAQPNVTITLASHNGGTYNYDINMSGCTGPCIDILNGQTAVLSGMAGVTAASVLSTDHLDECYSLTSLSTTAVLFTETVDSFGCSFGTPFMGHAFQVASSSNTVGAIQYSVQTDVGTFTGTTLGPVGAAFLDFPLRGSGPFTTEVSAIFDHDVNASSSGKPMFYTRNSSVRAFTAEQGLQQCGAPPCSQPLFKGSTSGLQGFKNASDTAFLQVLNGNYSGGSCLNSQVTPCSHFLFYSGHTGFDYPQVIFGSTEIFAPADGVLYIPDASIPDPFGESVAKFNVIAIDHGNGYASWFLHVGCERGTNDSRCALNGGDFRGIDVNGNQISGCSPNQLNSTGCPVHRGDVIGLVGNKGLGTRISITHLHYEVRKGLVEHSGSLPTCSWPSCVPVDPYGWTGPSGADPYSQFLNQHDNVRLWN